MSERKTEGKDHKEDGDEDDLEEPDLKVRESLWVGGKRTTTTTAVDVIVGSLYFYVVQQY